MIRASFRLAGGRVTGFTVQGHSFAAEEGQDIVCAAVSSAAYMTVNTLTDVLSVCAEISVRDGYMQCAVPDGEKCGDAVLQGFRLHMEQLAKQYPRRIKITTEV